MRKSRTQISIAIESPVLGPDRPKTGKTTTFNFYLVLQFSSDLNIIYFSHSPYQYLIFDRTEF